MTDPSPAASIDVFISHASTDDGIVTRIHAALAKAGITAWVDHEHGITPGDNFNATIQKAVNACQYGLFVLSPQSITREYCEAEWSRILTLGKKLYLAMIEPVPVADIPLRLGTIHYADLTRDFDAGLKSLIDAMRSQRGLDPTAATTGQALCISGPFPRWQLDLPIIGREADLTAVRNLLKGSNRLVAVLGMGGVGKTRLAAEIASTADPVQFPDGVIWHEIADYTSLATLTGLIRDHLRLTEKANDDQVWEALNKHAVLIVLDNAEASKEPAAYAARLNRLDLGGGTRVLMTSRAEWRDARNQQRPPHVPSESAAVEIFQAMVKVEPPIFAPNGQTPALVKAARFHPRLMQYAVKWLNYFPPDVVLTTLATLKGKDAEEALDEIVRKTVQQVRERPDGEAAIAALRRLAVCRGGFTYHAAQTLVGAEDGPRALATLKQWGLVAVEGSRYDIDPLVAAAVGEDSTVYTVHYEYYKMLAEQHDQKQDYHGLDPESANLEIAFDRALTRDPEAAYWLAAACYNFHENRGRMRQRMEWLKRAQVALADNPDEHLHAALNNSQGIAYDALSTLEERADNLRRAIVAYAEALRYRTPDTAPLDYAQTQNNLGVSYRNLSDMEERADNLRRAIAAYTEALRYYTPDSAPLAYAMTQQNLGTAYWTLAAVEERAENLRRAIAAYTEALRYRTPDSAPLAYAMTQNNLGAAYTDLAAIEERAENLRRAIAASTEALHYYTPDSAPLAYAMTQNNLGNAYADLAAVEERAENLRRAIAAYTEALRYHTPDSAPLAYAMTQNNLGTTYRALSDVEERAENLRRAIAAYTEALRYRTPDSVPLAYAMTQQNLGIALEATGDLAEAVTCWREAERYYRRMDAAEYADLLQRVIVDREQRLASGAAESEAGDPSDQSPG